MSATNPVTCETLLEQISGYLDGDLDADTCRLIEAHAVDCPTCAHVIDDFRKTTGLCRQAAAAPLPDSVRELAKARVAELLRTTRSS